MGKLTAHLSPLLSTGIAKRLEKDPGSAEESWHNALNAAKELYVAGHEEASDEFTKTINDYYHTAVEAYAKGKLDEEDFEGIRVRTSAQVRSLVDRYKGQL
jgi:hypothetical protein